MLPSISAFYLVFGACTRAKAAYDGIPIRDVPNILDNPAEAAIRIFITTIGEFTVFYRELNACKDGLMEVIGKASFRNVSILYYSLFRNFVLFGC